MSLDPATFLDGIDEGEFGQTAGLSLWLQLDEQGYMDSDFKNARDKLEQKLAEYQ